MLYRLTRKVDGRIMTISDQSLAGALLDIAGGGHTEEQTRNALLWLEQLRQGETVETDRWSIRPATEEGK
jgi:hypothetical protein